MVKRRVRWFLFVALSIFALSCSPAEAPPVVSRAGAGHASGAGAGYTSGVAAGDFAPGQLQAHYAKHGYQFRGMTQAQYLQAARDLLNAYTSEDVLQKTRSNGDVLRYRVSTGEFAVMTVSGRIRTYFKADYRYWTRQ